ncbi:MAG: RNA repair domain-containing protein [Promethearchaeota archaeon]
MRIRDILNRLRWHPEEDIQDYEITFTHRGAFQDRKTIHAEEIDEILSSYFTYKEREETVVIPFHRILEIRNRKTGEITWKKR